MAVNESRSMNADLFLGATDGSTPTLTPGRGGVVDPFNNTTRHTPGLTGRKGSARVLPVPEIPVLGPDHGPTYTQS